MVHLANRKPSIVMFNSDTMFNNVCTDTCILYHRKLMKVQPLHVPVDCISTLKKKNLFMDTFVTSALRDGSMEFNDLYLHFSVFCDNTSNRFCILQSNKF